MYYNSGRSYTGQSESAVFAEHAADHILKLSAPYALRRNNADRPLLNELNSSGHNEIERFVKKTFPKCNISKIRQVYAPHMYGMYMLRHEEMKLTLGRGRVHEKSLYHVTTESRATKSLDSGLDWRLTNRNKFGCGVSFSDDADYANYYADNSPREETRVIVICSVLVGETYVIPGQNVAAGSNLIVPPGCADTTVSHNGRVYVKYNDYEFYPRFLVYYRRRPEHMTKSKYFRADSGRATSRGDTLEQMCSDHRDAMEDYYADDPLEQMCSDYRDAMEDYYADY